MRRFRIDLEYDGGDFFGWQGQADQRTVQGVLEAACEHLAGEPVKVTGAGRTDRGCHASWQVAHVDLGAHLETRVVARFLRASLPSDLRVRSVRPVTAAFHARFEARARHYVYIIVERPSVFWNRYAWCVRRRLDERQLVRAAEAVLGSHDFQHFAVRGSDTPTTECEVRRAEWTRRRDCLRFRIEADRFLRRMVRMLVGAMVGGGGSGATPEAIAAQLDGACATRPAPAPPQGLYLAGVGYTQTFGDHAVTSDGDEEVHTS